MNTKRLPFNQILMQDVDYIIIVAFYKQQNYINVAAEMF